MQLLKLFALALAFSFVSAQEISKPQISNIAGVPSDRSFTGTCTASTQGYVDIPEAKMGKWLYSKLQEGYVITIYPKTHDGIFVDMECRVTKRTNAPAHP